MLDFLGAASQGDADMDIASPSLCTPRSRSLWESALADPEAFGLPADFSDLDALDGDEDEEEDAPRGDQHNAHVLAYRTRKERCEHLSDLTRGLLRIQHHLDGSPGCTRMGHSEDWCHHRHLWADEADLLAWAEGTPYEPTEGHPVYPVKGYPSCSLPWWGWPPLVGHDKPHLFMLRIWQAEAEVRAQIAAAGGLDDDHGRITRTTMPSFGRFAEWRRDIFTPPSERAARAKAMRRERKTADQRQQRAKVRAAKKQAAPTPPVGKTGKRLRRPIEVFADHAMVPLTNGYKARISLADVPLVDGYNWSVRAVSGRAPVAVRTGKGEDGKSRNLFMHHTPGLSGPVAVVTPMAPTEGSLSLAA